MTLKNLSFPGMASCSYQSSVTHLFGGWRTAAIIAAQTQQSPSWSPGSRSVTAPAAGRGRGDRGIRALRSTRTTCAITNKLKDSKSQVSTITLYTSIYTPVTLVSVTSQKQSKITYIRKNYIFEIPGGDFTLLCPYLT